MSKKIMIIDDSALMRKVISDIINSENGFEVSDIARNGVEGLKKITANPTAYDAMILDVNMPQMGGLELLEELYKAQIKHRTIIVSSTAEEGTKETIRALELGAFDFVRKPDGSSETAMPEFKAALLDTLRMMFDTDKLKKPPAPARKVIAPAKSMPAKHTRVPGRYRNTSGTLVALASSTGGPKALQTLIKNLPADLNAPVVIVQHMPKGFTLSLAQRLDELCSIKVSEAKEDEVLEKGHVYIAPGGRHIEIVDVSGVHRIRLNDSPPVEALRPCADVMYASLQDSSYSKIVCVVLTGMGMDGTKGITNLGEQKNIYVIAQDKESSIVYGMPKAVRDAGLADEVVPLDKIADAIKKNVGVS